jgi:DNA-binding CsgD family transcriptional regulator
MPNASTAVEELTRRQDRSPTDLVRAATAEVFSLRRLGLRAEINVEEALHALQVVADPRVRSGFLNAWAYHLILTGQYDLAYETAERMRDEAESYQLGWVRPHAHWTLAAAAFGRRQFGVADNWLQRVEQAADQLRYGQLTLNASCLRARILLALRRPDEALSALSVDETQRANRAMRGEFAATKALVYAVLGARDASVRAAKQAAEVTLCVEARAYAACSRAILTQSAGAPSTEVAEVLSVVGELAAWDVLVSAVRAWPALAVSLSDSSMRPETVAALRSSNDYDLARHAGIDIGRRPRHAGPTQTLSPREAEVIELVRQGFTDGEIAQALFISEATVRVHMRHIREKTGSRSRAEAVATLQANT